MSSVVVPNAGELKLVEWALKGSPENLTLKLYTNDYTPVAASVAGSFTEATFADYAAKTLTAGSWGTAATDANGKAAISYAAQTWTGGTAANETCYGWYCVGATSGTIIMAGRFSSAKTVAEGETLTINPAVTLASEN